MNHLSLLGPQDLHLFNEGTHRRLWEVFGAHPGERDGRAGTTFAVWAPNAERVEVIGDFNHWQAGYALSAVENSGVWAGFIEGVGRGDLYKYRVYSRHDGYVSERSDPLGIRHEQPPRTASVVWDLDYTWGDQAWMKERAERNALTAPMSIYELHVGSWLRVVEEGGRPPTYRELAPKLADYVERLGFTHVEFMPLMEHPFSGSWGYQVTGFFAATSRFGTPQDLMYLIDYLHQRGIGVLLDWVPSHFPTDGHGLQYFDGTHLYEHADPRQGFHPDWKSSIFNYGRKEVASFLTSSALFWLDKFHADGLRVDGVASMLYLDYSREEGEWVPNDYGGRENVAAIDLIRQVNIACYAEHPDVQIFAEESTAWTGVTNPTDVGGLGFGFKWDMGWMHDTLQFMQRDPIHRTFHLNELTFRAVYAMNENFVLPLSHDEVVHGKGSLLSKMPGDDWQKFANLRLLYAYMWTTPGKKLLFMSGEFGQWAEWNHDESLDWHLADFDRHHQLQALLSRLNRIYRQHECLHAMDYDVHGFEWVRHDDHQNSAISYLRKGRNERDLALVIVNVTPVVRDDYVVGVPLSGGWLELFNSDALEYGGSGVGNAGYVETEPQPSDGRAQSIRLKLPPLGVLILKPA